MEVIARDVRSRWPNVVHDKEGCNRSAFLPHLF
jgi:hypothetical protein